MHFYRDERNYSKKWITLFYRQITIYWQYQTIDFNSVLSKQDKKQKFKNYNFILLPNILFHLITVFYLTKKNYHTLIKNILKNFFSFCTWPASKERGWGLQKLGNSIF